MHNFKQLTVWKKALKLASDIYVATQPFPNSEIYGLTSQIRRSAISIASNIAEGSGRSTNKDFKNFLHIAYGSCCELETQILISQELNFSEKIISDRLLLEIDSIQKMLFKLIEKYT